MTGAPFDSTNGLQPALVLDREEWGQVLLEQVSGGASIQPDIPMWVSVVAVDTSGNAWLEALETSMISPVDEESQDPGMHLPEVSGVMVYWDTSGSQIEVLWEASEDPQVSSYSVYASTMEFSDTRDAVLVESSVLTSNAAFSSIGPTPLSQSSNYWISVVAFDGEVHRFSVDSIRAYPLSEMTPGGNPQGQSPTGDSWYDQLVDGELNTFIALISAVMVVMGVVLIIRPRERAAPKPWEMGTMEVEMEEELAREAMGISEEEELESASMIQPTQVEKEPSEEKGQPVVIEDNEGSNWEPDLSVGDLLDSDEEEIGLEDLNSLADGLEEDDEQEDIDTSFIDDALGD